MPARELQNMFVANLGVFSIDVRTLSTASIEQAPSVMDAGHIYDKKGKPQLTTSFAHKYLYFAHIEHGHTPAYGT